MILHDPDAQSSLAIVFFANEEDYRKGDAALNAMPAGDTPGSRTSVTKYDVAIRVTASPINAHVPRPFRDGALSVLPTATR